MSNQEKNTSFIGNLLERRFPQFFATYIAASWGAIQFLEWGVKRYSIPSHWVDKLVLFLVLILPFVISVIYFHGKAGDDKWHKFEKIFYPINIVVALLCSLFLVNTTASTTEKVSITDMDGQTTMREIPKQEYNQRVAVFQTGEAEADHKWKGVAISELLNNKMEQDMRMLVSSAGSLMDYYEDYGFKKYEDVPFATKLKIAEDDYADYFVTSEFVDNKSNTIDLKVYETKSGKEVSQEIITGNDLYDITDQASKIINKAVKISEVEGKELYKDLPASNLISSDTVALKSFIEAKMVRILEPANLASAYQHFQSSVDQDPTCAECWIGLALIKLMSGQDQNEERANALKYGENLPERQQLGIKNLNYMALNDVDKAIKLNEMWRKLYPQDTKPVENLMILFNMTFSIEDSKKVAKEAIDNGHKGSIYLSYANLLIGTKDWDAAEKYLKLYKEKYPKQFEATSLLVDTYAGKGELAKAEEVLEEMIVMKPHEKNYQMKKAQLLSKQNKFDEAISVLNSALVETDNPNESIQNYLNQLEVFRRALRFEEFGQTRRKLKALFLKNYPPGQYLQTEYQTVGYFKDVGQKESIAFHIKGISELIPPSRRKEVENMNEFIVKLYSDEKNGLRESYEKIRPLFENLNSEFILLLYDSEVLFIEEKYEEALPVFAQLKEVATDASMVTNTYHETHFILGKYKEGLDVVNNLLKEDPLNPVVNLFKARFQQKLGKSEEAKKTMNLVKDVFKASDQRYKYTIIANEFMKELGM